MDNSTLLQYVDRNLPHLSKMFSDQSLETRNILIDSFLDTPNPAITAGRIGDLIGSENRAVVEEIMLSSLCCPPFFRVMGGSGFLFSVTWRHPELLEAVFLREGYKVQKTREIMSRELQDRISENTDRDTLNRILRRYKEEEYLRIGCRDLSETASVQEIMKELSSLACACVSAAVSFHYKLLAARHGVPKGEAPNTGLVVLGLGKVSGNELNFSSDLDLMFLRGPEEGATAGPKIITVKSFYESLVHGVNRTLSDVTEDGFVFRVDLRLRPEGEKGELVPSVNNALDYYLSWGRTWERAALMKARPIAGDVDLGEEFLLELEPFIFRKYLDYSTLEEMRSMKLKIERSLKRKPGVNIKLGQGGIREIEFFVQTLQLINGGKIRRLRSASTMKALQLLQESELLDARTAEFLADAYLFFRKTEHRIQIDQQLQTHELPKTSAQQDELARRMGYRNHALERFLSDLDSRRRLVEELFASMFFHSAEEILQQSSPLTKQIIDRIEDHEGVLDLLRGRDFRNPEESYLILKSIIHPHERKGSTEKGKQLLEKLAPLFLDEILKSPDPQHALISLDRYIDSLHSTSSYFSTFLENPTTARFLVRILGESLFFTDLLTRHPQIIDSLIGKSSHSELRDRGQLESDLYDRLENCEDYESELDALRRFKHEQVLSIGVRQLWGEIESSKARRHVTELAETCLSAALNIAKKEMFRRYGGDGEEFPFATLGLGKLGGREMTYWSDLDVIFVYQFVKEKMGRLSAHEWFTRLATRVISILSAYTGEGKVFELDTRLRPSGNKGPLVSSLNSFQDYHRDISQLWERQALIRARPIVGPVWLQQALRDIVRDCLTRNPFSEGDLQEIARLRGRMEQEIAAENDFHVDLKTGQGGLVDIEFLVQGNILKYAKNFPEIICPNTLDGLRSLHHQGLIADEAFGILENAYRFLINIEDRLRLMEHRSVDRIPLSGEKLTGLAQRLGYGKGEEARLLEEYFRNTRAVRDIYRSFFGQH